MRNKLIDKDKILSKEELRVSNLERIMILNLQLSERKYAFILLIEALSRNRLSFKIIDKIK